ncbi:MAG: hypothetical protein AVDCRST_MAG68-554 [uncultured Gemmatimonadetes bacterium]|uniref:DUF4338 domain-containing protein n=1 Tax=uncultured Gemmatimonadota bacterium TaxID=203437 RepID=A0A6J4K908_9BACT|nr:MAG: hypothetical protein AVDCRST_MAG68-554 [uncultured Gemmatimonadota bacterium]
MCEWNPLRPGVTDDAELDALFLEWGRALERAQSTAELRAERAVMDTRVASVVSPRGLEMRVLISLLYDLRAMGWRFRVLDGAVATCAPDIDGLSAADQRASVREGHLLERDAQLAQPATRAFISAMERRRPTASGWHSVFSLMRDGRELATVLDLARSSPEGPVRETALANAIKPYIQLVRRGDRCRFTGLELASVWRYFRHTWTTVYQTTPGRNLAFLVRDSAAPNHPVVGIGALGSSIVQLRVRDSWIGWTAEEFVARVKARPTLAWARWLDRESRELITDVYYGDLVAEGVVTDEEISRPTTEAVDRLRTFAREARQHHRLFPQKEDHSRHGGETLEECETRARTHLFRFKRASALADLLSVRRDLADAGFTAPSVARLRRALSSPAGERALVSVLRRVKAKRVGVNMMDVTVCGAVAPYNALLGGKLVSLLMASSDVSRAYSACYADATSVIASGMAARPVKRNAALVLLGTTGLYSSSPSQYNRLRVPAEEVGGRRGAELRYVPLGRTSGYGSYHFSKGSMELMETFLAQRQRGRQVNSIFGEGVNPKLRKVKAALDAVGLPGELLTQHGQSRLVYGIPLATNFREVLFGVERRPQYIVPQRRSTARAIARFWIRRWLSKRIEQPGVLEGVGSHTLVYPVVHGARVPALAASTDDFALALG